MGTDQAEHVGDRSLWWLVGYVTTVGGGVVTGAVGLSRAVHVEAIALAVVLLLAAAWLRYNDRRTPRCVRATAEGVTIASPARDEVLAWDEVRRVRTAGGHGLPSYDTYLDLVDGALVALPRKLPAGTVEHWRDELAGARPQSGFPDTWRVTDVALSWRGIASAVVLSLSVQFAVPELGVFGVVAVAVGAFLALLVFWHFNPLRLSPRQVSADETQVRFGRGGRRRVSWSEVAAVRTLDGYQDTPVLERHDGSVVKVAGPPMSVIQGWRESSTRS